MSGEGTGVEPELEVKVRLQPVYGLLGVTASMGSKARVQAGFL